MSNEVNELYDCLSDENKTEYDNWLGDRFSAGKIPSDDERINYIVSLTNNECESCKI